ncbi:UDP-glycosyltransferase UGT5-like isoform X25 [Planococcus citri]|uniref:UDP-glycosyltransferase UGT5-like isoform X25 n=1 Tax=Planococcus citri TaxID=170843 RepID=UPI0031F87AF8
MYAKFFIIFVCFSCSSSFASSYEILGIFSLPAKSHYIVFEPLLIALAERGHNVTVYNTFPKKYTIPNYNEIDISKCFHLPDILTIPQMKAMTVNGFASNDQIFVFVPSYKEITSCKPIMDLINSTSKYDLLITESFNTDFFLLFGWLFEIPSVTFNPNSPVTLVAEFKGLPYNPSYIPHFLRGFAPRMNFLERVENFLLNLYSMYSYRKNSLQVFDRIAKRIFGPDVPPLEEVARNVSLLLLNTHFTMNPVRPMVPNVVEVAGLNIKSAKPLDNENIEKFINESKHGVVYFCMGSLLRGETFPPEKREAFLYAFSKIPQRVLWKWEGDVLPGKSDNIMISKWMPQRDILAHPNVKLFISHGGLLGTSEAVYEGVPVLGIPIFGDQRTNIKSLEANGAGELLDYNEISKEVVLEKIQRLLNDPKYKENAKLLSDRYRDRPMSPLDTAVYWTEYVIRHKGAPHLRTAAADMPWYQYLLLDVIAFIVAVLVAGLLIIYYTTKFILRAIYGLICGGGAKKGSSKSDKKKRN